jgi:hypothetical protein
MPLNLDTFPTTIVIQTHISLERKNKAEKIVYSRSFDAL